MLRYTPVQRGGEALRSRAIIALFSIRLTASL